MAISIESAEKLIHENFNDSTIQVLFKNSGKSQEQFTKQFAADLVKLQESEGKALDFQAKGIFPIKKNFPLDGIAELDVTIDQDGAGYYVEVDSYILGYHIGRSRLNFQDGVLSRHESAGNSSLGAEYWVSLQIAGGFSATIRVHLWLHMLFVKKDVNGGPWILP